MTLLFAILVAILIWQSVLKPSAYPKSIPAGVKIIHALILFFASLYAWSGVRQLVWLLFHPHADFWGSPPLFIVALVCWGMAGAGLMVFCYGMAGRNKSAMRWFLIFWTLTFLCGLFVTETRFRAAFGDEDTIPTIVTLVGIFILTLAFYLRRPNKIFAEEVG
jgi:hypothetical protein